MLTRFITFSMIKSFLLELLIGYVVIFLIGYLILLPGKDKIQNIANKNDREEVKKENVKARKWLCIGWTLIVIGLNVYIILTTQRSV